MKSISICILMLAIVGCKTSQRSASASRSKMYDGMPAGGASSEDSNKNGVCLLYSANSKKAPDCKESTVSKCMGQNSTNIRAMFVSSANCKCYKLESEYLTKNPPADPYDYESTADSQASGPQWALTNSKTVVRSGSTGSAPSTDAMPQPGPDDVAVEITDTLAPFYKEHPECVIAKDDVLMP